MPIERINSELEEAIILQTGYFKFKYSNHELFRKFSPLAPRLDEIVIAGTLTDKETDYHCLNKVLKFIDSYPNERRTQMRFAIMVIAANSYSYPSDLLLGKIRESDSSLSNATAIRDAGSDILLTFKGWLPFSKTNMPLLDVSLISETETVQKYEIDCGGPPLGDISNDLEIRRNAYGVGTIDQMLVRTFGMPETTVDDEPGISTMLQQHPDGKYTHDTLVEIIAMIRSKPGSGVKRVPFGDWDWNDPRLRENFNNAFDEYKTKFTRSTAKLPGPSL
jgi:hypothetical protein